MTHRTLRLTDDLYDYYCQVGLRESVILKELREETAKLPTHRMQIAPEQGQLMALLVELLGAKRILEIGTYTGYSALAMAQALPMNGYLLTCDIDPIATHIAQTYWQKAAQDHKIDLRLAPALQTLNLLLTEEGAAESFDMVFIDADKTAYRHYYELALQLTRPGGLILLDNVLWNGRLVDPNDTQTRTVALRELNQLLHQDTRISLSMLPIGDGLTLARKR